jgi:hypothetical protein
MTMAIAEDLGAWLVLRRVQWGGVTIDPNSRTLYDRGDPLPGCLTPHVLQLTDRGYVRLSDPLPYMLPCRRVHLTDAGERMLDLLYDLSRAWHARQRVGLRRDTSDLDTLAQVLNGHRRMPVINRGR